MRIGEDADRVDRIGNRGSEATIDAGVFKGVFLKLVRCWRERRAFRPFSGCVRGAKVRNRTFSFPVIPNHIPMFCSHGWEHHVVTNFKLENSLLVQ